MSAAEASKFSLWSQKGQWLDAAPGTGDLLPGRLPGQALWGDQPGGWRAVPTSYLMRMGFP